MIFFYKFFSKDYNGMSFYRQGVKNSPEYDLSLTGANTRSRKKVDVLENQNLRRKKNQSKKSQKNSLQETACSWTPALSLKSLKRKR